MFYFINTLLFAGSLENFFISEILNSTGSKMDSRKIDTGKIHVTYDIDVASRCKKIRKLDSSGSLYRKLEDMTKSRCEVQLDFFRYQAIKLEADLVFVSELSTNCIKPMIAYAYMCK
jgi:hypothetical protein